MSDVFNQGALDANRHGRLTLFQAIGLLPLILLGGIFFLMAFGMSGAFIYNNLDNTLTNQLISMVLVVPVFLFLLFFAYLMGGKRLIDLIIGKVSQVEGRGNKYSGAGSGRGGSTQRVLYYSVGNEKFQIAFYGTWKKLPGETMVRAYYTPLSKTLVNVEPTTSQSGTAKIDLELEGLRMLEEMRKAKK